MTRSSAGRFAAAIAAGIVAYLLLPLTEQGTAAIAFALARAVFAGGVVGLTLPDESTRPRLAAALAAGALGFTAASAAGAEPGAIGAVGVLLSPASAALAIGLRRRIGSTRVQVLALAGILAIGLVLSGLLPLPVARTQALERAERLSVQPVPEQYSFDGDVFLRTRDLMKQGWPYYQAFRTAIEQDTRLNEDSLPSPFNFREPFLFHLWRLLPGATPYALLVWFVLLSLTAAACSYLLASTLVGPGPALLAPMAMVSYLFQFWWSGTWFAMVEIWAAFFGVAALMCLVRGWRLPSIVLLLCAIATREFMVLLVPVWLAHWWFGSVTGQRRQRWWEPVAVTLLPVLILGAHVLAAPTAGTPAPGFAQWMHGGLDKLVAALRFGWSRVPGGDWLSLAMLLLAATGAALARPRARMLALALAVVIPTVFLTLISNVQWGEYWGAFFGPIVISLAPAAAAPWVPTESSALATLQNAD